MFTYLAAIFAYRNFPVRVIYIFLTPLIFIIITTSFYCHDPVNALHVFCPCKQLGVISSIQENKFLFVHVKLTHSSGHRRQSETLFYQGPVPFYSYFSIGLT